MSKHKPHLILCSLITAEVLVLFIYTFIIGYGWNYTEGCIKWIAVALVLVGIFLVLLLIWQIVKYLFRE